jgi:hypothetical protein
MESDLSVSQNVDGISQNARGFLRGVEILLRARIVFDDCY